jgi:hypothetical protein
MQVPTTCHDLPARSRCGRTDDGSHSCLAIPRWSSTEGHALSSWHTQYSQRPCSKTVPTRLRTVDIGRRPACSFQRWVTSGSFQRHAYLCPHTIEEDATPHCSPFNRPMAACAHVPLRFLTRYPLLGQSPPQWTVSMVCYRHGGAIVQPLVSMPHGHVYPTSGRGQYPSP